MYCLSFSWFEQLSFDFDRLERLEHLAEKFNLKCDLHEGWSSGKEEMLQSQDFKKCRLSDLKVKLSKAGKQSILVQ